MTSRRLVAACAASFLTVWLSHAGPARADEVRYYEKNGVTWCETRRTVQERVPESRVEQQTETVYREEFTTEIQETTRTRWTPVTEYRWEAFWAGRWNPFVGPYLAYRYVPRTRWERRTETVKMPVNARRLVPETRTVRRLVGGFRVVEREVVSHVPVGGSRVPVGGALASQRVAPIQAPALAQRPEIGGVSRMHNDPPRYGTATAWRASSDTLR